MDRFQASFLHCATREEKPFIVHLLMIIIFKIISREFSYCCLYSFQPSLQNGNNSAISSLLMCGFWLANSSLIFEIFMLFVTTVKVDSYWNHLSSSSKRLRSKSIFLFDIEFVTFYVNFIPFKVSACRVMSSLCG